MSRQAPFATLRAFTRTGGDGAPDVVRRLRERKVTARPGERCEMCGEPLADEHAHVANLDDRRLMCACRACYLLFTREGAGSGRRRAVPEEYAYDPDFVLTDSQWDSLQIPVGLAFFFQQSNLGRFVACYPSPGGATESELDVDSWAEVVEANPVLRDLEPDVEAALVRRADGAFRCFRTPIDACYQLVGIVRTHWVGFHGGDEVWRHIDAFFAELRRRSGVDEGAGFGE